MSDPDDTLAGPPVTHDLAGTTVGRFAVKGRIGAGGMGQVYRAEDTILKRAVAIKRMTPNRQFEERDRDKFLKEAQRASALNHPNIAAIYDVLLEKGEILLVMEYVQGTTLRKRLAAPLTVPEFLEIATQCAEGLGAAHEQHIVHRDIKPENIMLTATHRVKILDFGVAMRFAGTDPNDGTQSLLSLNSSLSGTPGYMAPEVLQQRPYDGRADLFSLGLVFYEMLGGPHPFKTDSFAGTIARVLHRDPPSLTEINRTVPVPLAGIVQHLLEKDPDERYASAPALLADLNAVRRGEKPSVSLARPKSASAAGPLKTRFGKTTFIALGLLLLLAALWFGFKASVGQRSYIAGSVKTVGLPQDINLAVLPLEVDEGDRKFSAFANGLLETVTAKLNELGENHSLQVISSNEMRSKNATSIEQARQEFGVNLGLRIGLQRSGELVRATYTLIDAKTGRSLASKSFDAPMSDPFRLEDDVAEGAARALGMKLKPEERTTLVAHGTSIPEAHNYYLQASGYLDDHFKAENISSAITVLTEALRLDSNYGVARAKLGMAYWWRYDLTKDRDAVSLAKSACTQAVASGTAGAEGHICLGIVANGTGEYTSAVAEFQKAVDLDSSDDQAYSGLASAYEHSNRPDDAEKTYQRAIEIRPQSSRNFINLGAFFLRQQEIDKAVTAFVRGVALAPDSYRGYSNLGGAYLYQARFDQAIQSLQKSIAIRPTFEAYTNLGTAYLRQRRFRDAVGAYQRAVKLDGGQYATWGSLGDALHFSGDAAGANEAYDKAIALAKKLIEVNPKDAEVLGDLADYYAMVGDRKDAITRMDESLRWGHGDKDLLFNAAVIHQELGERGEALEWLKKSLDAGYPVATVQDAPSFDALKNDAGFQALILGQRNR